MTLTPEAFRVRLAQPLPPIVSLAGEEPLLLQEALDAVRVAARKQGYGERTRLDVEPGFSWSSLIAECGSMSLFADLRLIEVHMAKGPNGHKRKKAEAAEARGEDGAVADDGIKALASLQSQPPQGVCLLLVFTDAENPPRQQKWFDQLASASLCLYASAVGNEALPAFARQRAQRLGLGLGNDAVEELCTRTEGNLLALQQELEKLALLYPNSSIDAATLAASVANAARFDPFDLADKILRGKAAEAVRALQRLREEGVHPLELTGALAYTLRAWATAAQATQSGLAIASALAQARIFGTRRAAYETALRRRGFAPAAGLVRLGDIDKACKSGREAYAWEELLTLTLAAVGAGNLLSKPKT